MSRDVLDGIEGHTPGPWKWCGTAIESEFTGPPMYGWVMACGPYCQGGQPDIAISDSDRALIARAPDLVQEIVRLREALWEIRGEARQIGLPGIENIVNAFLPDNSP